MIDRTIARAVVCATALAAFALATGACGGGEAALPTPPVPAAVVPSSVEASGGLTIHPNSSPEIEAAFDSVGSASLVEEGRVWEVRQGDRLVGVLELATLLPRIDTRKEGDRLSIRQPVFPGAPAELDFFGVPVYSAKDGERSIYLWYGRQVLGVLQLKGSIDPDSVATELITVALQDTRWPGLPPEDFEEE